MQAIPARALVLAAAIALPVGGLIAPVSPQESAEVVRLGQEVQTLRYRLDLEAQQLRRDLDSLRDQFRDLDFRQRQGAPLMPSPAVPVPGPTERSAGPTGDEIVTRRLAIEDDRGRVRAVMTVSDAFGPMLALLDETGNVRLLASQPLAGPGIELRDAEGRVVGRLAPAEQP